MPSKYLLLEMYVSSMGLARSYGLISKFENKNQQLIIPRRCWPNTKWNKSRVDLFVLGCLCLSLLPLCSFPQSLPPWLREYHSWLCPIPSAFPLLSISVCLLWIWVSSVPQAGLELLAALAFLPRAGIIGLHGHTGLKFFGLLISC